MQEHFTSNGPFLDNYYQIQKLYNPKWIIENGITYIHQKLLQNIEQAFTGDFKNQSEIVVLLLKNKRNVKIIPLWLHNTKLEVRNVCLS